MFALFRAMSERVNKALFVTDAALDFEADLVARAAERQADLLRQADRYDAEGLTGIAQNLRRQVEALSLQRPLAGVLPAIDHLIGTDGNLNTLLLQTALTVEPSVVLPQRLPAAKPKKKGR